VVRVFAPIAAPAVPTNLPLAPVPGPVFLWFFILRRRGSVCSVLGLSKCLPPRSQLQSKRVPICTHAPPDAPAPKTSFRLLHLLPVPRDYLCRPWRLLANRVSFRPPTLPFKHRTPLPFEVRFFLFTPCRLERCLPDDFVSRKRSSPHPRLLLSVFLLSILPSVKASHTSLCSSEGSRSPPIPLLLADFPEIAFSARCPLPILRPHSTLGFFLIELIFSLQAPAETFPPLFYFLCEFKP